MHIGRILDNNGVPRLVRRVSAETIQPLSGNIFGQFLGSRRPFVYRDRIVLPLVPSKVVGIGSNYTKHIEEMGRQKPKRPKVFRKTIPV